MFGPNVKSIDAIQKVITENFANKDYRKRFIILLFEYLVFETRTTEPNWSKCFQYAIRWVVDIYNCGSENLKTVLFDRLPEEDFYYYVEEYCESTFEVNLIIHDFFYYACILINDKNVGLIHFILEDLPEEMQNRLFNQIYPQIDARIIDSLVDTDEPPTVLVDLLFTQKIAVQKIAFCNMKGDVIERCALFDVVDNFVFCCYESVNYKKLFSLIILEGKYDVNEIDRFGNDVIMMLCANAKSIRETESEDDRDMMFENLDNAVKLILSREGYSLTKKNKNGKTALALAIENGLDDVVDSLARAMFDNPNTRDFFYAEIARYCRLEKSETYLSVWRMTAVDAFKQVAKIRSTFTPIFERSPTPGSLNSDSPQDGHNSIDESFHTFEMTSEEFNFIDVNDDLFRQHINHLKQKYGDLNLVRIKGKPLLIYLCDIKYYVHIQNLTKRIEINKFDELLTSRLKILIEMGDLDVELVDNNAQSVLYYTVFYGFQRASCYLISVLITQGFWNDDFVGKFNAYNETPIVSRMTMIIDQYGLYWEQLMKYKRVKQLLLSFTPEEVAEKMALSPQVIMNINPPTSDFLPTECVELFEAKSSEAVMCRERECIEHISRSSLVVSK